LAQTIQSGNTEKREEGAAAVVRSHRPHPDNYFKDDGFSGQIVNFLLREEFGADALVYFEGSQTLAAALGDIRAMWLIHAAY